MIVRAPARTANPGREAVKCPACSNEMSEVQVQDVCVDVCEGGCGGIWFDWLELKKVDEAHESLGEDLLHIARDARAQVDLEARRHCPRCKGQALLRHFASVKREVTIDECPACGGFFLDHGEINGIRAQYPSEDERSEAAEALFDDLIAEGFADIAAESAARTEKARGLARMFRFLLPSYYIPGKQKWGAF